MKNYPGFILTFVKFIDTREFVCSVVPQKRQEEVQYIVKQIGACLFQFELDDGAQQKALIKNRRETTRFIEWFNHKFNKQLKVHNLTSGMKFPEIQQLPINEFSDCFQFMQFELKGIFSYKLIKMIKRIKKMPMKTCLRLCTQHSHWQECVILITSYGLIEKVNHHIRNFYLFNSNFSIQYDQKILEIVIITSNSKVWLRARDLTQFYVFLYYLQRMLHHPNEIRYGGSAYLRQRNQVTFLIDTKKYFQTVALEMESATQQIFICGWWVSPELPLIRQSDSKQQNIEKYILKNLLYKKACQGVHISIIVFNNPPIIPNDSKYTKKSLEELHNNIKVYRHPSDIIPTLWTHHEKLVIIDQKIAFLGGIDLCYGRYDTSFHPIISNSQTIYPGIQYNNIRIKDFTKVSKPSIDSIPRNKPRLPWHDISLKVEGHCVIDLCNHFIEYWNHCEVQKAVLEQNSEFTVKTVENDELGQIKTNEAFEEMRGNLERKIEEKKQEISIKQQRKSRRKRIRLSIENIDLIKFGYQKLYMKFKKYKDKCQFLRSASHWSIGLPPSKFERSIQTAYIDLIINAKTHIYIENQFFISATGSLNSHIKNQVANAIYIRIKMALEKGQKFRVIIFIPLLPGFEGKMNQSASLSLCLITHWQQMTISRGPKSLIGRLKQITDTPQQYIQFYGLRQHGILQGRPVTEIIYVHSKLMIIDDELIVCGSANINQRSLTGTRDSEIALVIQGQKNTKKKIGGVQKYVCEKAHNLRIQLYKEHFNLDHVHEDPLDQSLSVKLLEIAQTNTEIYRQLFGCYPDDNIKWLFESHQFQKKPTLQKYNLLSKYIRGHAVRYPLEYLSEQCLNLYAPDIIHDVVI